MPTMQKRMPARQPRYLTASDLPEIIDTNMIAQYLGVSEGTVRNWRDLPADPLPAIKIERRVMFRRDAFFDWLERKECCT